MYGYDIPLSSVPPACLLVCGVPLAMVGYASQTRVFRYPRLYCGVLYIHKCVHIGIYVYIYIYIYRSFYHTYKRSSASRWHSEVYSEKASRVCR